jgi:hypothetical protein
VHVVVHHRLGEEIYQAPLDLEALGRRNVLEVDPAEPRCDARDRRDELLDVLRVDQIGTALMPTSCE